MNADHLRALIGYALAKHPEEVADCRTVATIYADRVALEVTDLDGRVWRVHVLTEPREGDQ